MARARSVYRDQGNLQMAVVLAKLEGPFANRLEVGGHLKLREELLDLVQFIVDAGLAVGHSEHHAEWNTDWDGVSVMKRAVRLRQQAAQLIVLNGA